MTATSDARFWDRTARKYARSAIADQDGYERTLARTRTFLRPGDRAMELGCGTGSTALRLADGVESYVATDISAEMIAVADEKLAATPDPALSFRVETAETMVARAERFDVVLGFNYLHLVRDVPATLKGIRDLLPDGGLFVSKTPCLGDMNPLIGHALLPVMRLVGQAPHVSVFNAGELKRMIGVAGFELLAVEGHASRGRDTRPFIVARKA